MHPKPLTDKKIIDQLQGLRSEAGQGGLGSRDLVHLRRHQRYELREVALEDIQFQPQSHQGHEVDRHSPSPQGDDSPIVLDGVWMTPWEGVAQLCAAKERGDTHIMAHLGLHPRPDRTYIPDPREKEAWNVAQALHSHFLTMVAWRTPRDPDPANRVPDLPELLGLAEGAHLEFMDEEGKSLLGSAVEAWQQAPYSDLVRPVLNCLLRRGANPDRTTQLTLKPEEAHTPFHWALLEYHPSPVVLDPEEPLPSHVWEMFQPHLDLTLPKNQAFVGWWLGRAGDRPLGKVAERVRLALSQAGLESNLPDPAPPRPSVRL